MTRALTMALLTVLILAGCSEKDSDPPAASTTSGADAAELTMHRVVAAAGNKDDVAAAEGETLVEAEGGNEFLVIDEAAVDGQDVAQATAKMDPSGSPAITIEFTDKGGEAFGDLSAAAACAESPQNRIAILIDGEVLSSPAVRSECDVPLTGGIDITGDFSKEEAAELAEAINAGH